MKLATLALLTILSLHSYSQSPCMDHVSGSAVTCMAENWQFVFIGTEDNGVQRYDKWSEELLTFNTDNSNLPSNHITSITRYGGQIMLCVDSSLYEFDTFNAFTLLNEGIWGELSTTGDGRLAVAGPVDYYEWYLGEVEYHKDLLEQVVFSCNICEHSTDLVSNFAGDRWISHWGFYEFDILHYDGNDWTTYDWTNAPTLPIESPDPLNRLTEIDGVLHATTWDALLKFEDEEWQVIHSYQEPTIFIGDEPLQDVPTDIEPDQTQGFWMGTQRIGWQLPQVKLLYFDNTDWQYFDFPEKLDIVITRLVASISHSNLIFVGTNVGMFVVDKDCLGIDVGVEETAKKAISVYPNPSSGGVHIDFESASENHTITIFDHLGRELSRSSKLGGQRVSISLPQAAGVYYLRIEDEIGGVVSERVLKF